MTTLHPSNPWFAYDKHLDQQSEAILEPYEPKRQSPQRSASVDTGDLLSQSPESASPSERPRYIPAYRTRSVGGPWGGVYFERRLDLSPPNDEEIIIATVRVTNSFRRASREGCEELPSRPPARGFMRRMSTRLSGSPDPDRYTAIKMPRKDFKRYFARDKDGKYAGTEPEREWSEEDLKRYFGEYQDLPLRSIPGCSEFGEGDPGRRHSAWEASQRPRAVW